jgi:Peptidase M61 N-terminal domain
MGLSRRLVRSLIATAATSAALCSAAFAQQPVQYRVSFPAPEHHYAEVEVTFPAVPGATLEARMSRSSPGRYAVHEFAKNVFDLRAYDGKGRELRPTRPDPYQWNVTGHDGTVRICHDRRRPGARSGDRRINRRNSDTGAEELSRRVACSARRPRRRRAIVPGD